LHSKICDVQYNYFKCGAANDEGRAAVGNAPSVDASSAYSVTT